MTHHRLTLAFCCLTSLLSAQQPDLPPAPGRLIDVGGRRLHIICSGQGAPTVVLEAGASSFGIVMGGGGGPACPGAWARGVETARAAIAASAKRCRVMSRIITEAP